jgi:hypothetical protein
MPVLSNPKHERFAQLVAGGANKTEAAKSLGYSPTRAASTGCNLAKDRNIGARITELSLRASEQAICSVAMSRTFILEKLKTCIELATRLEDDGRTPAPTFNLSAAAQHIRLAGIEIGMFRENIDHTHQMIPPEKMTEEQLAHWLAYFEQQVAAGGAALVPAISRPVTVDVASEPFL